MISVENHSVARRLGSSPQRKQEEDRQLESTTQAPTSSGRPSLLPSIGVCSDEEVNEGVLARLDTLHSRLRIDQNRETRHEGLREGIHI